MTGRTLEELSRSVDTLERRLSAAEDKFVTQKIHDLTVGEMKEDIRDIKDSQKWMQRLLVGNFVTLVVALILFLLERSAG